MLYDRKIKYLDYFEHGGRVKGGGFLKLEVRDGILRLQLNVKGLYPTDSFAREVILVGVKKEEVLGQITIVEGNGSFNYTCRLDQNIGGTGIPYDEFQEIRIPVGGSRELRCVWEKKPARTFSESGDEDMRADRLAKDAKSVSLPEESLEQANLPGKNPKPVDLAEKDSGQVSLSEKDSKPADLAEKDSGQVSLEEKDSGQVGLAEKDSGQVGLAEKDFGQVGLSEKGSGQVSLEEKDSGQVSLAEKDSEQEELPGKSFGQTSPVENGFGQEEHFSPINTAGNVSGQTNPPEGYLGQGNMADNGPEQEGRPGECSSQANRMEDVSGQIEPAGDALQQDCMVTEGMKPGHDFDDPAAVGAEAKREQDGVTSGAVGTVKSGRAASEKMQQKDAELQAMWSKSRQDTSHTGRRATVKLLEEKWQQLDAIYPHIRPFKDDREYLSLSPSDFVLFPAKYYRAANNSFLLHGYYNYKHLILARVERRGDAIYYLGVPGNYYDREKQVAVMFGFESFECAQEPARTGDFGYYMMRMEL